MLALSDAAHVSAVYDGPRLLFVLGSWGSRGSTAYGRPASGDFINRHDEFPLFDSLLRFCLPRSGIIAWALSR